MEKLYIKNEINLSSLIALKGYSLKTFAKRVGVSNPYLSQIVNNKRNPSPVVARKICFELGIENISHIFFTNNACKRTLEREKVNE